MAKLTFPTQLQEYTEGIQQIQVSANNYRDLVVELGQRFPELSEELLGTQALSINGAVIPSPLLETFEADSDLVFIPWMQGG